MRGRPQANFQKDKRYRLPKGMAWNPLLGLPRNSRCPCHSGKKFKNCHLDVLPKVIPEKLAQEYSEGIKVGAQFNFIREETAADIAERELRKSE